MRFPSWFSVPVLMLVMTLGGNLSAWAQTDEDHFQTFPFNFSNPGARSTAMGGAFIGAADDATAAVANPAGLASLTRKQVYIEFKSLVAPVGQMSLSNSLVSGFGTLNGPWTGLPGFINFAMPVNDKVTIAVSSHQFLSYNNDFDLNPRRTIGISTQVFPETHTPVDIKAFSFSGSVGMAVSPKVRIGASGSLNRLSASVDATRCFNLPDPRCPLTTAPVATAAIPSTEIHDSSWAPGVTGGVLFQVTDALSIGGLYAYEPHFELTEQMKAGELDRLPTGGGIRQAWAADANGWQIPFNIPSRAGVGVAYRPTDRVLGVFDLNYVRYSTLGNFTPDQLVLFRHTESFTRLPGTTAATLEPADAVHLADATRFHIDNGFNVLGGAEVMLVRGSNPVFLRFGGQRVAPHAVTYGDSCAASPLNHQSDFNPPSSAGPLETELQKGFGRPGTDCNIVGQYYFAARNSAFGKSVSGTGNTAVPDDPIVLDKAEIGVSIGGGMAVGRAAQIDVAYLQTTYKRKEFIISSAIRF